MVVLYPRFSMHWGGFASRDCKRLFWELKAAGMIVMDVVQRWLVAVAEHSSRVRPWPLLVLELGRVRQRDGEL